MRHHSQQIRMKNGCIRIPEYEEMNQGTKPENNVHNFRKYHFFRLVTCISSQEVWGVQIWLFLKRSERLGAEWIKKCFQTLK